MVKLLSDISVCCPSCKKDVIARNYNTHECSPQINTQFKVAAKVINQLCSKIHQVTQYSKLGKYPCLWCLVILDDLISPTNGGIFTKRSLQSITRDHQRFVESGGSTRGVHQIPFHIFQCHSLYDSTVLTQWNVEQLSNSLLPRI